MVFQNKSRAQKEEQILNWMFSENVVNKVLRGELIKIEEVPQDPFELSLCLVDENVNWRVVERYLEKSAWTKMVHLMSCLQSDPKWFCRVCQEDLESFKSIVCESCLVWYHQKCVSINIPPKKAPWFCRFCYSNCCERDATETKVSPCMHAYTYIYNWFLSANQIIIIIMLNDGFLMLTF